MNNKIQDFRIGFALLSVSVEQAQNDLEQSKSKEALLQIQQALKLIKSIEKKVYSPELQDAE